MTQERQTVSVASLPITPFKSMNEAVNSILSKGGVMAGVAIAVNAEKVISAMDNSNVKNNLLNATLLYADGIAVVKTIKKKGVENERIPGCELWEQLMSKASMMGKKVYLLGASEDTNLKTANKLNSLYGLTNIVRRNGYYDSEEDIIEEVTNNRPDIVTVALGSPKQELLIAKLREAHPDAFYMGVGGSYDVFVGNVKRATKWIQKIHLEWFYRLILQPKRIFRQHVYLRYLYLHYMGKL